MSDDRSRHDRLAVRLSLIISRLMAVSVQPEPSGQNLTN